MTSCSDWAKHVFREHNVEADALASKAAFENKATHWMAPEAAGRRPVACRVFFDGSGGKSTGSIDMPVGSAAWALQACWDVNQKHWDEVAYACLPLPGANSMIAETVAATEAVAAVKCVMRGHALRFEKTGSPTKQKRRF